jgi:hypothetical protein
MAYSSPGLMDIRVPWAPSLGATKRPPRGYGEGEGGGSGRSADGSARWCTGRGTPSPAGRRGANSDLTILIEFERPRESGAEDLAQERVRTIPRAIGATGIRSSSRSPSSRCTASRFTCSRLRPSSAHSPINFDPRRPLFQSRARPSAPSSRDAWAYKTLGWPEDTWALERGHRRAGVPRG